MTKKLFRGKLLFVYNGINMGQFGLIIHNQLYVSKNYYQLLVFGITFRSPFRWPVNKTFFIISK